jgi:hypothetical protein
MDRVTVWDFGRVIMRADGLAPADIGLQDRPTGIHQAGPHLADPHLADPHLADRESAHPDPAVVPATTSIIVREDLEFARVRGRFP